MSTFFQGFDPADSEFPRADLVQAMLSQPDKTAGDLIVLYYVCLMASPDAEIGESADLVANALRQMVLDGNEEALLGTTALDILAADDESTESKAVAVAALGSVMSLPLVKSALWGDADRVEVADALETVSGITDNLLLSVYDLDDDELDELFE